MIFLPQLTVPGAVELVGPVLAVGDPVALLGGPHPRPRAALEGGGLSSASGVGSWTVRLVRGVQAVRDLKGGGRIFLKKALQ